MIKLINFFYGTTMWKYLFVILMMASNAMAEETKTQETKNAQNKEDIAEAEEILKDHSPSAQQMLIDYSKSDFRDPYDRWPDITGWIINNLYGFVPIPIIITEPAVGYGGGLSLLFVSPKKERFKEPPNLYAVAGAYTENGTYGFVGGYRLSFKKDRIRLLGGVGVVDANMEMNPIINLEKIGKEVAINVDNNIHSTFFVQRLEFRLFDSNFFAGALYSWFKNKVKNNKDYKLDPDVGPAAQEIINGLEDLAKEVLSNKLNKNVAHISPILSYDSRDSIFTPDKGIFSILYFGLYRDWLGSDYSFNTIDYVFTAWYPILNNVVLGGFLNYATMIGEDYPYYIQPSVSLRGANAFYYQGDQAFSNEYELRIDIVKRISILAIAGYGSGFSSGDNEQSFSDNMITTYGTGLRYLNSAPFKMRGGIDVVWGPKGPIFYIQFGTAWATRGGM